MKYLIRLQFTADMDLIPNKFTGNNIKMHNGKGTTFYTDYRTTYYSFLCIVIEVLSRIGRSN